VQPDSCVFHLVLPLSDDHDFIKPLHYNLECDKKEALLRNLNNFALLVDPVLVDESLEPFENRGREKPLVME